jgi:uncharacterized membrane protein
MPAVNIRLMESLAKVLAYTRNDGQRATLLRQADMVWRAGKASISEAGDWDEINRRYEQMHARFGVAVSA